MPLSLLWFERHIDFHICGRMWRGPLITVTFTPLKPWLVVRRRSALPLPCHVNPFDVHTARTSTTASFLVVTAGLVVSEYTWSQHGLNKIQYWDYAALLLQCLVLSNSNDHLDLYKLWCTQDRLQCVILFLAWECLEMVEESNYKQCENCFFSSLVTQLPTCSRLRECQLNDCWGLNITDHYLIS